MTALQQAILDYIRQHPGLTPEDVSERMADTENEALYKQYMQAIWYLIFNLHVSYHPVMGALTANQEV
jgi:hypothetical protein